MIDEGQKPPDLSERTKDFALRIINMFSALPKSEVARVLGKQVLRSGTDVGANYREAHRARSKAEFIAKIGDSPSARRVQSTPRHLHHHREEIEPQPFLIHPSCFILSP